MKYEEPEMQIIIMDESVITTSTGLNVGTDETTDEVWGPLF